MKSDYSSGELERLILRATDETLTGDNWLYILDVCDCISNNPELATKEAIKQVSLRLASKDANIILRTLSLLIAIAENCGSRMKQEIASRYFLEESMIKRLDDKKLHQTVKFRIVEVIQQLHQSFKNDPSLKPMTDAWEKVKSKYPQYMKNVDTAPTKPIKKKISDTDKQKEEEDLQRALKLSLQEYEREKVAKVLPQQEALKPLALSLGSTTAEVTAQDDQNATPNKPNDPSQGIAKVSKVRAMYDLISYEPEELSFRKGDIITVIESVYRDWWRGSLNGRVGIFPLNYVTPVVSKTPAQIAEELEEENKVLFQDLKKVDTLLSYLTSNPEVIDESEVTRLYSELVPLRASLARFVEKYSIRKQELCLLNSQLNSELKSYNEMVDKSIALKTNQFSYNYAAPPYPSGNFGRVQSPRSSHDAPEMYNPQLAQQPTGSGFGNVSYAPQQYPGIPKNPPSMGVQRDQSNQNLLNIRHFPDVNNL